MKRKQVDEILETQVSRKNKIIKFIIMIVIIILFSFTFLFLYLNNSKDYYVSYQEKSDLTYKVFLKENDFFKEKYLTENNQYIASLIDYIKAEFNYELNVEDLDIDYKYQYSIEGIINVLDKDTKNVLYTDKIDLVEEKTLSSYQQSKVNIKENVLIDYNYYNDMIKKFITTYDLNGSISTLEVKMYVKVLGNCDKTENANTNNVISLTIPLTTKTVAIDMDYNVLTSDVENVMICSDGNNNILYLIISIVLFIIDIVFIIMLFIYINNTRTAESIYHRELRKILNNYKSYIQKVNNEIDLKDYKIMKIDSFTDMLEIRDTIEEPILMTENKNKNSAYFVIPSKTNILYTYSINVKDIEKKMNLDNEQ